MLTDRGTWLNFRNRGDLAVLVEGDTAPVQPVRRDGGEPGKDIRRLNGADAQKFVDWVISPAGQAAIADYRIGGEQLFFPNAGQ